MKNKLWKRLTVQARGRGGDERSGDGEVNRKVGCSLSNVKHSAASCSCRGTSARLPQHLSVAPFRSSVNALKGATGQSPASRAAKDEKTFRFKKKREKKKASLKTSFPSSDENTSRYSVFHGVPTRKRAVAAVAPVRVHLLLEDVPTEVFFPHLLCWL